MGAAATASPPRPGLRPHAAATHPRRRARRGGADGPPRAPAPAQSPYVVPARRRRRDTIRSCSVGDAVNGYRLVGIPDGLGVLGTDDGAFRLFVNHETVLGCRHRPRAWQAPGAPSSPTTPSTPTTLEVRKGSRPRSTRTGSGTTGRATNSAPGVTRTSTGSAPPTWPRSRPSGIPHTRTGYNGRIFMNGEEAAEGRAFAHLVTGREHGTAWELPALGNFAWENALAAPRRRPGDRRGRDRRHQPARRGLRLRRRQAAGRHADRARRA